MKGSDLVSPFLSLTATTTTSLSPFQVGTQRRTERAREREERDRARAKFTHTDGDEDRDERSYFGFPFSFLNFRERSKWENVGLPVLLFEAPTPGKQVFYFSLFPRFSFFGKFYFSYLPFFSFFFSDLWTWQNSYSARVIPELDDFLCMVRFCAVLWPSTNYVNM